MFILLPIFFLSVVALAILLIQWLRPNFGFSWLLAALAAFLAWLSMVLLRLRLPISLILIEWKPQTLFNASPVLLLDRFSWPYGLGLITLVLAAILTDSARSQYHTNPYEWAGSLAISALGLVAIMAGNPLTLLMAWAAVDMVELFILQSNLQAQHFSQRIVLAYSARTAGLLIFFLAIVLSGANPATFTLKQISVQSGLLIFTGCGLRLGVLPLHLPFSHEPGLRRGLGTILRLVPVISTLVLLARLPATIVPEGWVPWLLGLVSLAALYGGAMWLVSEDELNGRPYWLLGWAALAFICVIRGYPIASVAWGIVLLLQGGFIFLYSARERYLLFLPVLGVWAIMGPPFSPAASGWIGLFEPRIDFFSILDYGAQILLVSGFIRHALRKGDPLSKIDRWAQAIYPVGMVFIMVTNIILGVWGWPGSLTSAYWWAGLMPLFAVTLFFSLRSLKIIPAKFINQPEDLPIMGLIPNMLNRLSNILRLDWLYNLIGSTYAAIGQVLNGVTAILEGDGGVLWALLLLTLLISLITSGGF